jgi:hypothetical protein
VSEDKAQESEPGMSSEELLSNTEKWFNENTDGASIAAAGEVIAMARNHLSVLRRIQRSLGQRRNGDNCRWTDNMVELIEATTGDLLHGAKDQEPRVTDLEIKTYFVTENVFIDSRGLLEKGWVILDRFGWVLNKYGEWELEPSPSRLSKEFIDRTRYETPEEALAQFETSEAMRDQEILSKRLKEKEAENASLTTELITADRRIARLQEELSIAKEALERRNI